MDLFSQQRHNHRSGVEPLSVRMRPRTLDEFVGQRSFLGEGQLLRRMLEADRITSALFFGPPGTGKTSLARLIAELTSSHFSQVNAASVGVKEIREILHQARDRLETRGTRTILFVDELHRFHTGQQDVLLQDVEDGIVILLGATTENPFFAINAPLISRSQVFQFEPLCGSDIRALLDRAVADEERGLGKLDVTLTPEGASHLAVISDGDARRALTALEVAVLSQADRSKAGKPILIDLETARASVQRKAIPYDRAGDMHYDSISAMIKSIRGGDPNATVYWLARMLEAGEDPRFIARRLVIAASEDVGNADPGGLVVAQAAADATQMIGLPECRFPLAQAAIYLARAPKSDAAANAIRVACEDVRSGSVLPVPKHLRSSGHRTTKEDAKGGADQHHDGAGAEIAEIPDWGVDKVYYTPTDQGAEARLRINPADARTR